MSIELYLSFVVIAILTIVSPGPAILVAINNGLKYNMKAVVASTLGNGLGLLVLAIASILGVSALFTISALFFTLFKVLGAFYLIYLGVKQITSSAKDLKLGKIKQSRNIEYYKLFKSSFLVAVTNPKPIIFFSTVLPLFVNYNSALTLQYAILIATFLVISFTSLISYGYISNRSTMWFNNKKRLKSFYNFSGIMFIFMGISMFFVENKSKIRV